MLITTAVLSALGGRKSGSSTSAAYIEAGILDNSGNIDTTLYNPNGVRHNNRLKSFFNSHYFKFFRQFSVAFAAFFMFLISALSVSGIFVGDQLAFAEEEIQWEDASEEEYSNALGSGAEGLEQEDFQDPGRMGQFMEEDGQGWGHVLYRIAGTHYLNDTREAVDPSLGFLGASNTPDKICIEPGNDHVAYYGSGDNTIRLGPNSYHSPDPELRPEANNPYFHEGVPHYHNCDIPNMMTQFYQFVVSVFAEQGLTNAELTSSYENLRIGLPDDGVLPGGSVPEREEDRNAKYTALEVFGYNLDYTMYQGEWDHIGALTEARMTANFGVLDHLTVVAHAVWNAVTAYAGTVIDGVVDGWESGNNILTKSAGAFMGLFRGAITGVDEAMQAGVRTVLDTSDYNIQRTNGWYRLHYPETAYGSRQLSQEEMQTIQISLMQQALTEALDEFVEGWRDSGTPQNYEAIQPSNMPSFDSTDALSTGGSAANTLGRYWETPVNSQSWYSNLGLSDEYSDYRDEDNEFGWSELAPLRSAAITTAVNENRADLLDFLWEEHLDGGWFQQINVDVNENEFGFNYDGFEQCIDDHSSYSQNSPALLEGCWSTAYAATTEAQQEAIQARAEIELEDSVVDSIVERFMSRPIGNPSSRFICTDELGRDLLDSDGRVQYVYPNITGQTSSIEVNDDCLIDKMRPPIQGALFGDGYIDYDAPTDTRREQFQAGEQITMSWVNSLLNGAANAQLGVTTTIAQWSNFLIELSFSPVLQSLGLDSVIVTMIESFRDSLFFPLSVLLIMIGGIVILWRVVAKKQYREGWFSILMVVLIFFSGVFVMADPERLVNLSDEIPSNIENALAAAVFTTANEDSDNICTATGGAFDPDAYEGTETIEGTRFNTNVVIRSMMCENWRVFAFSPWSHGQFGTSYTNLNDNSMQNTNSDLIGEGSVDFGGSNGTVNNWAIYQLNATTSGTTTTQDTIRGVGYTDPDVYRLVDLQAGPNNAERSDARYFDAWAGNQLFDRITTSFLSIIVSIFGLITIFLYVILKLEYTMLMTLLLLAMPIMFLFGLEPSNGKGKLREYFATLASLMFKRIMIVFMLAMFLRILASAGAASAVSGYIHLAVMIIVVCIVFIMFRKEFMKMVDDAAQKIGNTNFAGASEDGGIAKRMIPSHMQKTAGKLMSGSIGGGAVGAVIGASNSYKTSRSQGKGMASSLFSGAKGSAGGALNHGTKAARVEVQQALRRQRRSGFGIGANALDTSMAVRRELNNQTERATDKATLEAKRTFALSQYRAQKVAVENEKAALDKLIKESDLFGKYGSIAEGLSKEDERKAYEILKDRRRTGHQLKDLEAKIDVALHGNVDANSFGDLYANRSEREKASINRGVNKISDDIRSGVTVDDREYQQDTEAVRNKLEELDQFRRRIEDRADSVAGDADADSIVKGITRYNTAGPMPDFDTLSAEEQEKHIMENYETRGFGVSSTSGIDEHSAERRFRVIDPATGTEVQFRYNKDKDMWGALAVDNNEIFWKKAVDAKELGSLMEEANGKLSDKAKEAHAKDLDNGVLNEKSATDYEKQIMEEISELVDLTETEKEAMRRLAYGRNAEQQTGDTLKAMKAVVQAAAADYQNASEVRAGADPATVDTKRAQELVDEAKKLIKNDVTGTLEEVMYRRNRVTKAHNVAANSKTAKEAQKRTRTAEARLTGEKASNQLVDTARTVRKDIPHATRAAARTVKDTRKNVKKGTKKIVSEYSEITENSNKNMDQRQSARNKRQNGDIGDDK